jgi:hypothetical protein
MADGSCLSGVLVVEPVGARYFDEAEIAGLSPQLVEMLDRARGLAKVPFRITSGLRSSDAWTPTPPRMWAPSKEAN